MVEMLCDTVAETPSRSISLVDSCPPFTMNRLAVKVSAIPVICRTRNTPGTRAERLKMFLPFKGRSTIRLFSTTAPKVEVVDSTSCFGGDLHILAHRTQFHRDVSRDFLLCRQRHRVQNVFPKACLLRCDAIGARRELPDQEKSRLIGGGFVVRILRDVGNRDLGVGQKGSGWI